MGDRWAWRSDVSSRRSQLDTDSSNDVIVKEIQDDNTLTQADKVQEESSRTARKVESESPEARFFLKDKLCAIGLADCSTKLSEAVQYVQPVQVIPVGQPIPAVAAEGFQYTVPVETPIANRDFSVSSGYGAPSYEAPIPSYGAPKPSYNAPKPSYGAPKPSYDAPKPSYGAPKPSYGAPKPSYGAPKPTYNQPSISYGPPSYDTPTSGYRGPKPSYDAPTSQYGAPQASNSPTSSEYGAPKPTYNAPSVSYGSPLTSYNSLTSKLDTISSFQTSFSGQASDLSEKTRPVREGRLDECYCVPVAQCPADKILGSSYKDYSKLINPRVKNADIGITAPAGRTLIDTENTEKIAEEDEIVEEASETVLGKERSLVDSLEGEYDYVEDVSETDKKQEEEVSRRRRDNDDKEEGSPKVEKTRLENVFVPDEEKEEFELLSRDGPGAELNDLDLEEKRLLREEKRNIRKKERQEKRKKEQAKNDKDVLIDNSDLDDIAGQDKSFDSIGSFTGDVTDKVGSVGNSVTSGVTRIFGDISNLIGTSTSTGQLQPTIGFSFGLPQSYPGYAGYPQNPVGSGGAVNPYYTAQEGVQVGPVNLNPLFSLQAGTTDSGDLSIKPLVNLHLTPNGCGILGCDKTGGSGIIPKSIIEAFTNPFGIHSEDYLNKNGISSDYVAPQASYSSSYGVPDTTYNAPSTGYGAPSSSYGAPQSSYGASQSSYGAPQSSYGAPQSSYGAPQSSYGAPQSSYGAPQSSYGAPKPSYEAPQSSYGSPKPSYEAPQSSFLEPVKTFFGLSKPSYEPPESSYSTPTQVSNSKHNSASSGLHNTHVHHHYHHQDEPSTSYTREDNSDESSFFLQDSNQVKRKAEDFFGSQPNIGGKSSSSSSGFRFPRGRDGRNLKLKEDIKEVDSLESETDAEEVNQKRKEVKSGSSFKFADRKKRSPDGIGNNGHHGHHDPNAQHAHHDQHVHHDQQAHHNINVAQQIPDTRSGPFGPNGYRPPSCGGPGSGFVCCSVSDASGVGFNELTGENTIRDTRQEPQELNQLVSVNQFSTFGQCGKRNAHGVNGRINNPAQTYNEGDTEFGEYPWQAALLKKEQYDNVYVCGGSLIDASHILTAAHCIKQYRPEELRIRLGEWDVNNDSEFYPNIEMDVLSINIHPEFYSGNLYNDIAIIKLDGFVDFQRNPHISPVCLPDAFQSFAGKRCFVSGWGKDAFGGNGHYQNVLKEVDVPVLSHFDCERKLKKTRLGFDFVLHPGFICAGGEEGKDACKGDGGGPLVCDVGGVWQLAGIISWGVGCGEQDIPGVYAKVGHYNQWVQEMMLTT